MLSILLKIVSLRRISISTENLVHSKSEKEKKGKSTRHIVNQLIKILILRNIACQ